MIDFGHKHPNIGCLCLFIGWFIRFDTEIRVTIMKLATIKHLNLILQIAIWLLIFSVKSAFLQIASQGEIPVAHAYFDSLSSADEAIFQRKFEFPFLALLDNNTKTSYLKLSSIDQRKSFIRGYWLQQQPNPLSPRHDLLEAFLTRWNYVQRHFSSVRTPFFDDRGQIYLKYGEPSLRYQDSGGRRSINLFKDRQVYRYISQLYGGFPPASEYFVYPNESWVYRDLGLEFVIHFVKQGDDFRQVSDLSQAIESGIAKNMAWYWGDLVQSRAHLTPSFSRAANLALEIQQDLLNQSVMRSSNTIQKDRRLPHERLLEQKKIQEIETTRYVSTAPSFFVPIHSDLNKIHFSTDVAQFRGDHDSTRIEIHFRMPFRGNITKNSFSELLTIEYQTLIRDQMFAPVRHVQDSTCYSASLIQEIPNAIGLIQFSALPIVGDITLQLRMSGTEQVGFIKQPIVVRDFSAPKVMISDIQFYFSPQKIDKLPQSIVRTIQDVRLIPYPFEQVQKKRPVFCYFEVYNLKSAAISNQFKLKLEIAKDKVSQGALKRALRWLTRAKDGFISLDQTRTPVQDRELELIELDLGKLKAGDYLMSVTVSWNDDPQNHASVQKRFGIVE